MRIRIESAEMVIEDRVDQKGQPYQTRKQRASVENGTKYPLEFLVSVPKGHPAYAVGEYDVEAAFSSDQYGNLSLSRYMTLRPVAVKPAAVRAG